MLSKCMHKSIVNPHLIAFLLTDTYYIISNSKYLPTAKYEDTMAEVSRSIS